MARKSRSRAGSLQTSYQAVERAEGSQCGRNLLIQITVLSRLFAQTSLAPILFFFFKILSVNSLGQGWFGTHSALLCFLCVIVLDSVIIMQIIVVAGRDCTERSLGICKSDSGNTVISERKSIVHIS